MTLVTIDIETVPTQNIEQIAEIKGNISPPGNITKAESIQKWFDKNRESAGEEEVLKTSFNGGMGQVTHIGYKIEDTASQCIYVDNLSRDSERDILMKFDAVMLKHLDTTYKQPYFIGHNIAEFDLKFLFHRFVVNNIKPSFIIPWSDAPWKNTYFDTMTGWSGFRNSVSLKQLCKYLDIPSPKGDLDGSKVWGAIQEGRYTEVANYCVDDADATYEAFKRLTFK
jgi:predicted PolB exonuclease-like 3'-5' exonuclease